MRARWERGWARFTLWLVALAGTGLGLLGIAAPGWWAVEALKPGGDLGGLGGRGAAVAGSIVAPAVSLAPGQGAMPVCATPTGTPAARFAALPDLAPASMWIGFETGSDCDWAHSRFGLNAVVVNQGGAEAAAFVVDLDEGLEQQSIAGLAAGAQARLFFSRYHYGAPDVLVVDVYGDVAESDEGNNVLSAWLPIPTPPLTCTATPSPTQSPGPRAYLPALLKGPLEGRQDP